MGINLDEIVAASGSVADLLNALTSESESNTKASAQILQITNAAKGTMAPLDLIKSKAAESATTSKSALPPLSETDAVYARYVADTATAGQQPLSPEDFKSRIQEMLDQQSAKGAK